MDHKYDYGDLIWYNDGKRKHPGMVTDPRDGFELEIVTGARATTAHITELEPRSDG